MNETTKTMAIDPGTFLVPVVINLIVLVILIAIPVMIARWFVVKERERKEQLDRIESKLDQMKN